ncbi:MAG: hypothetical protein QXO17_06415 [Nitrososphaerota archaeon]
MKMLSQPFMLSHALANGMAPIFELLREVYVKSGFRRRLNDLGIPELHRHTRIYCGLDSISYPSPSIFKGPQGWEVSLSEGPGGEGGEDISMALQEAKVVM